MENKAHYALIGVFVLLSLIASVSFALWLSAAQFNKQYDKYDVSFHGAVRGLSQGSEVRFNGIQVGEVLGIRLSPEDPGIVIANIQVQTNTPIETKSFARLEPLGLTGLNYIQIFSGGGPFTPIPEPADKGLHIIRGEMSQIDSFLDDGGTVIQSAQGALSRINTVMTPEAINDFHAILANIRRVTDDVDVSGFDMEELNASIRAIRVAAENVSEASNGVTATSATLDALVKEDVRRIIARAETSLAQVDKTLVTFDGAGGQVDDLVIDARDAINRLTNSGLTDLEETVDGMRRLVMTLGRIADQFEGDPAQFIAGSEKDLVEIPK